LLRILSFLQAFVQSLVQFSESGFVHTCFIVASHIVHFVFINEDENDDGDDCAGFRHLELQMQNHGRDTRTRLFLSLLAKK